MDTKKSGVNMAFPDFEFTELGRLLDAKPTRRTSKGLDSAVSGGNEAKAE